MRILFIKVLEDWERLESAINQIELIAVLLKNGYFCSNYRESTMTWEEAKQSALRGEMLLFVDTETTGVPIDPTASFKNIDNWPTIAQLAWQVYDKEGQLWDARNYVVSKEIDSEQITEPDYVPTVILPIHVILSRLSNILRYCDVIIGHNIQYDVQVILCEFYRYGMETDKLQTKRQFCTMKNSVNACGFETNNGERYPKLQELYSKLFHHPFQNAHDAYCDIKATADCYWALFSKGYLNKADFPYLLPNSERESIIERYVSDGVQLVNNYVNRGCSANDTPPLEALSLFEKAIQLNPSSSNTKDCVGKACLKCARSMYSGGAMTISFRFFKKAADTGYGEALAAQASFERDKEEKKMLLLKAVEKGWLDAAYSLYYIYKDEGDNMSAERYSKMWFSYCEDNFDSLPEGIATWYIRCFLFGDLGHPADYSKAESLCKRTIARGIDNYSQYAKLLELCGEWEKRFEILNQDLSSYRARFEKKITNISRIITSAKKERELSQAFHANDKIIVKKILPIIGCYLEGLGTEKDYKKAKELIDEGISHIWADNEDSDMLHFYRGDYYEKGYGVIPVSFEKAFQDYKAASEHNAEAQRKVGIMYLEGKGCVKDKKLARLYLERAKSKGLDVSPYLEKAKSWF